MAGGMGVNKDKFIEDWNHARENLQLTFHWSRRNLAISGFFGVAVPILVYTGIVNEFKQKALKTKKEAKGKKPTKNKLKIPSSTNQQKKKEPYQHMQDENWGRPPRKFL